MLQVDFTATQSQDGETLRITDISAYADPDGLSNIQNRTITLLKADGTALAGFNNPISFPVIAGTGDFIDISVDKDYALSVSLIITPVSAQSGSIYTKERDLILLNKSKSKLYDREARVDLNIVECETSYNTVNYTILRYIDGATERASRGDLTGAQRLLDKISNITIKDCDC